MQGSLMCFLSFWCIFLLQLLVLVFTSVVFCEPWQHFLFFFMIFSYFAVHLVSQGQTSSGHDLSCHTLYMYFIIF